MGIQQALEGEAKGRAGPDAAASRSQAVSPARHGFSPGTARAGRARPSQTAPRGSPCSAATVPSPAGDSILGGGSTRRSQTPRRGPSQCQPSRSGPEGLGEPPAPRRDRGAQPCRPAGQRGPAESGQRGWSERFFIDRNLIPNPGPRR